MAQLILNLFGSFNLRVGEQRLQDFSSRKVQALLIYLAVEHDQSHRRDKLINLLWPGMPEKSARHNLRQALYQLSQSVPNIEENGTGSEIPLVVADRQTIQLNPDAEAKVDIHQFEKYLEAVHSHEHVLLADCVTCREALGKAIELYCGDFLAYFYLEDSNEFEDWGRGYREHFRREVLKTLDTLTNIYIRERDYERAHEFCERQLKIDPLRENAHQQMMAILTLSDQRPLALAQYETFEQLLQDELGTAPSEKTKLLYEQLLKGNMPFDSYLSDDAQIREARTVGTCPYRGLAAFREVDAPFFFGRESFTEQLYTAVQSQPLVAVIVGPSGAGKSSVLQAGLLPKLREADAGRWLIAEFRPGSQPFQSLATALLPLLEPELSETERLAETRKLADSLKQGQVPLFDVIHRAVTRDEEAERVLLFVDQFEELYTLCKDSEIQQTFLDSLLGAVKVSETDCDACLVLLNTLRADFMGQALGYRPFADALQDASLMLGPMTREELQSAIEKPAELQGAAFETGLVERLLDDVGQSPGTLPLLEFALTLLWGNMDQGWLTHAAYERIGRVAGALATYADQVYDGLKSEEQEQARRAFMQLVQPGQGTEDTRRVATRTDLVGVNWSLIQHLADKRLVVTGLDDAGVEAVEVVHEALIRSWGQLQSWIVEDRAFRIWQENLRVALRSWEDSGRDDGALLRGVPLGQAEEWLQARGDEIGDFERGFIKVSVDFREVREAERTRQRQLITGGLAVGFAIALLLSAVAFNQRGIAQDNALLAGQNAAIATHAQGQALLEAATAVAAQEQAQAAQVAEAAQKEAAIAAREQEAAQRAEAERQANISLANSLMAQSGLKLEQPDLALLLSLEAHDRLDTPQTKGALLDAIQNSPGVAHFLTDHTKGVESVAVSPDGRIIASVEWDGVMRFWELATGQPLQEHPPIQLNYVEELAFSPVCVSLPGASAEECKQILAAVGCVPNEAGSCDRDEILLWDMTEGDNFGQPIGEPLSSGGVLSVEVVFSPDGQTLATWGCTRTTGVEYDDCSDVEVVFWDVQTIFRNASGQHEDPIKGRIPNLGEWWLFGLEYNPDGTMLAIGGCEEVLPETDYCIRSFVKLFEAVTGRLIWESYFTTPRLVFDVAFSPDGTRLAAGGCGEGDPDSAETGITNLCKEGILVFLDAATGEVVGKPLKGHISYINSVAFSPDGRLLASGSTDSTIILWDTKTGEPVGNPLTGHAWDIYDVDFTPDGQFLVSASEDSTVGIWDLSTHGGIGSMLAESDDVLGDLAYSPDGSILAVGDVYGAIHLWDTSTYKPLDFSPIQGHEPGLVWDVAFSPDGKMLASASADNVIRFWDPATGDSISPVLKTRATDPDSIGTFAIDFSPDGNTLVTSGWYNPPGSGDPQIYVWDVPSITTGEIISRSLTGHPVPVINFDFSPDGSLMVSSDWNAVVNMWDTETWESVAVFTHPTALSIPGIRFSPDGKILAGGTVSGEVHLWDVFTLQPIYPPLTGYQADVGRVSFSPDGETLAAGSEDEVRLWDVPTGQSIGLSLTGQSGHIWNMVFHPDGHTLATSSRGGTVYLWDVDVESWRRRACELAGRNFTQAEWAQYLPGVPYGKTCEQW